MKLDQLIPRPEGVESFRRSRQKFVPETSGCYVLATFAHEILYIGLATNIRSRMGNHLDDVEKRSLTEDGRAVWFAWLPCEELNKVERTWMNEHAIAEGRLPLLNRAYSPTAT